MHDDPLRDDLPEAHALALRLADAGAGREVIARVLGIDEEAVVPLLEIAARKRDALVTTEGRTPLT